MMTQTSSELKFQYYELDQESSHSFVSSLASESATSVSIPNTYRADVIGNTSTISQIPQRRRRKTKPFRTSAHDTSAGYILELGFKGYGKIIRMNHYQELTHLTLAKSKVSQINHGGIKKHSFAENSALSRNASSKRHLRQLSKI